ncbi:hypothetical protein G9A89_008113 [Geosiphon pyriformis]|nr:hypothetical protein G9A89_008113 [Geosiphon pyriformis]
MSPKVKKQKIEDKDKDKGKETVETKDISTSPEKGLFNDLAPELFINICKFLSPKDLSKLLLACRRFHNFLSTVDSFSTELIWREARLTFFPTYDLPPPEGVSECDYLRLLVERGCKLCGKKTTGPAQIHWEFVVRCCHDCFLSNIIYDHRLSSVASIPDELIPALPYGRRYNCQVYWIPQVKKICEEYNAIPKGEQANWLKEHIAKAQRAVKEKLPRQASRVRANNQKKNERQQEIKSRVELMLKETDEYGNLKFERDRVTKLGTIYWWAITADYTNKFTDLAWHRLRRKIESEYYKNISMDIAASRIIGRNN